MSKIEAVIFDWGGVMVDDPAPGYVRYCAKALVVDEASLQRAYHLFGDDFQTNKVTEQQFWRKMTGYLKVQMPGQKSLWGDAFKAVYREKPEMFKLAVTLRQDGCKTALLSNTEMPVVCFYDSFKYDMFDVVVFSCVEGVRKPHRRIYELTLKKLNLAPQQAVFVDDRADFIEGAKAVGLRTITFKDPPSTAEEFRRLNLLPADP
jgi:epoxide hydrolase-like predicted phosphatase